MTRISELLTPQLGSLVKETRATLPRLEDATDVEGVHDLRVSLRRLRSLLRPARKVYGRFHTDAVRAALKRVADATGTLRDEEVLVETLQGLTLTPAVAQARDAWLLVRAARKRSLRGALLRAVRAGEVEGALTMLDALLALPVPSKRDRDAARFAREVVFSAESAVHAGAAVPTTDTEGLHALRILYKRLRYAVDGFAAALSPELAAIAPVAAKFQKRLGEVHDLDVARLTITRARALEPAVGAALIAAIDAARAKTVLRYEQERQKGGPARDVALAPQPMPAPAPAKRSADKARAAPVARPRARPASRKK